MEKEKEEEEKSARKLLKRQEREKAKKKEEDKESEETPVVDEPGIKKDESNFNSDQPEIDPIENVEKNNQKKNSSSKNSKKPKSSGVQEVDEAEFSFVPAPPNVDIPEVTLKKSYLYGNVNYFQESTAITGLVPTVSDLKYIGVGGKFILEKQSYFPNGTRFSILAGIPIFKEEYKFPIYRSIESEIFISNPSRNFKLYMGLDYMPIYFVGLPSQGTGLQVFEDDFIWGKIGLEFDGNFFNRNLEIRFSYLKSLISKSNQNNKIIGSKSNVSAYYQIKDNHGAEITINSIKATGAFELSSQKVMISYVYKFEN